MSITLTNSEMLLLGRRRDRLTQTQTAKLYHVTPKRYGEWERGTVIPPFTLAGWRRDKKLRPHERCLILRRRKKLTQAAVARNMRCSRWWLNRMEQGKAPVGQLEAYWHD